MRDILIKGPLWVMGLERDLVGQALIGLKKGAFGTRKGHYGLFRLLGSKKALMGLKRARNEKALWGFRRLY